jgi:hypothetical protein
MTVMTRLIFSAVLVATVCVPFIAAMSSNEASAQQRLGGTLTLRHAASLPKAVRRLH